MVNNTCLALETKYDLDGWSDSWEVLSSANRAPQSSSTLLKIHLPKTSESSSITGQLQITWAAVNDFEFPAEVGIEALGLLLPVVIRWGIEIRHFNEYPEHFCESLSSLLEYNLYNIVTSKFVE